MQIRQYPCMKYYNTFIAELPAHRNASALDTPYDTADSGAPAGRIVMYYKQKWVTRERAVEIAVWRPDGSCVVNPAVANAFETGKLRRFIWWAGASAAYWQHGMQLLSTTNALKWWQWPHVPQGTPKSFQKRTWDCHTQRYAEDVDEKGNPMWCVRKLNDSNLYVFSDVSVLAADRRKPPVFRDLANSQARAALPGQDRGLIQNTAGDTLITYSRYLQILNQRAEQLRKIRRVLRTLRDNEPLRQQMQRELAAFLGQEWLDNLATAYGNPPLSGRSRIASSTVTYVPPDIVFPAIGERRNRHVSMEEKEE